MKMKSRTRFSFISILIIAVLLTEVFIVNNVSKTYAATIPEKFDLRDEISIVVKNQAQNGICPYMSRSTVVETALKLGKKNGKYEWFKETPVFSVLTCKTAGGYVSVSVDRTEKVINEFYNGKYKTEQEILNVDGEYGNAKLQEKLAELEPSLDTEHGGKSDSSNITKFTQMAAMLKEYDTDKNLKYKSSKGVEYSQTEINDIRNEIKESIMNKGALVSSIQTTGIRDGLNGGKVCCNKTITTAGGDHSIAIIGWDDNYSKENFPEEIRPSSNGAYLIQNSWGEDWGDRGTLWVSYEDLYVEMSILCVDDIVEYKDVTAPSISEVPSEDNKKLTIKVMDRYGSGVDESSIKYKWTEHNILPDINDKSWTYIKNGEIIDNEESKYIWIYAKDKAGNENLMYDGEIGQGLIIENVPKGWSTSDVVLSIKDAFTLINVHDRFKMVTSSSTISPEELQAMDKELENYDHEFTINKEGKHTIYFSKLDEYGRELRAQKYEIWIDKTDPTKPTITMDGKTISIKPGKDETSGVKETTIAVTDKEGNPIEIGNKTEFDLETGVYTIEATTYDNAGNKSTEKQTIEVKDNEEPGKPGDDDKKDENPAKPGDDDKKDEEPVKPGDDDKKDENPAKPGDGDKEDEEPVKPGNGDKEDEEPVKPGNDEKKDEETANTGDDDKKDEEPKESDDNNKKKPETENQNSGSNGGINSNNGGSQSNNTGLSNQDVTNSNVESGINTKNQNQAKSGLPQTGSDIELKFVILIVGTIFLMYVIHIYRKVKNS